MVIAILISGAVLTALGALMLLVMSSREGAKLIPPKYERPIVRATSHGRVRINGEDD